MTAKKIDLTIYWRNKKHYSMKMVLNEFYLMEVW